MIPTFTEGYAPASDAEIERFETRLGRPLPAAYRAWLQTVNGGLASPAWFRADSGRIHEIALWGGLNEAAGEGPYHLLQRHRVGEYLFRAPTDWICIARSWDGNLLFLDLGDQGLYFWLHDAHPEQIWNRGPEPERMPDRLERMGIEKIAPSLTALLAAGLSDDERTALLLA